MKKSKSKGGTPSGGAAAGGKRSPKKPIEQYEHKDKTRVPIPPVGLVTPDTDPLTPTPSAKPPAKTYQYDPHLDPQLVWAGKAERTSFDIPTVSLHVHERIDPRTIMEAVKAVSPSPGTPGEGRGGGHQQLPLFGRPEENRPLREEFPFYDHKRPLGWKNRLIAGDSLLVMNSLLEKEGLGGQVQMVYLDPPYGIRYGSNFQPFVNKRDVKDGSDEDLTLEPETLKAFRDTWELGIHSYLTYLRDRLLLAKELLHESGSCFVQLSSENLHRVTAIMDEVFGTGNRVETITFRKKTMPLGGRLLEGICDYIVWYAKDKEKVKYRSLYETMHVEGDSHWNILLKADGSTRRMTAEEVDRHALLPPDSDIGQLISLYPTGVFNTGLYDFEFDGKKYKPAAGRCWKTPVEGMRRLAIANRLVPYSGGETLRYILRLSDYPVTPLSNIWADTSAATDMRYAVETSTKVIQRCLLMTTDPGDLVLDPTCGSGTTAYVAEQWGRRWITTDTSRVAITLAKQRLMTATFDYYTLAHPDQGVGSGFKYKTVPHVTLKSIANNPEIKDGMSREQIDRAIAKYADTETLYDQPEVDNKKARVTGPFTVEAVPAAVFGRPEVRPITPSPGTPGEGGGGGSSPADANQPPPRPSPGVPGEGGILQPDPSLARSGETLRQSEWRAELFKAGIRAKGGTKIEFVRVEPLPATRWLSADAETKEEQAKARAGSRRAVISFGPEHAPLEQRQVAQALEEAQTLVPKPALVIFASLQFDPEAAKDIDETNWPGVTLLKAQMNGDLVTDDLKKKRSSNESFWLVGQPDVELRKSPPPSLAPSPPRKGDVKAQATTTYVVEVHGFDYYNPKSGKVESGGAKNIAMWMLDPDYDGRSVYPRQVFFPMAGPKDGWARLAKNLKAEIDQDLIEQYRGTVSLPFEKGKHARVAVKIVDDRGIESLRIVGIP